MTTNTFSRLFYLALAAIGVYVILTAQSFKATAYPTALGAILCACSLIQFFRTFRNRKARNDGKNGEESEKQKARNDAENEWEAAQPNGGEAEDQEGAQAEETERSPLRLASEQRAVLWTMLAFLAYLLLLKPLGFILASVAFMAGLMWLHGYRYPARIAAISLPVSFGLYLFFTRVVHIGLPSGILPF